tara:strand:+ start:1098 stop:1349 length:252 start_codon:yes stop_codon:yes gene_type:complete
MPSLYEMVNGQKRRRKPSSPNKNVNMISVPPQIILHMPEVAAMVRHLDMLYSGMMIDGSAPGSHSMYDSISWYNTGDSRVREG